VALKSALRARIGDPAEAGATWLLYAVFGLLPVDAASWLGGALARLIGPRLRVTQNARRNLARIFPHLAPEEIERIVRAMWDNLGRTAGEHPHLRQFDPYKANPRVELIGAEHVDNVRDDGRTGLFFGGHLANWELAPLAGVKRGITVHVIYRRANNPFFDSIVQRSRAVLGGDLYPKGSEGAKQVLRAMRRGDHLAMLVDQKMNDGISVPFLGVDAMTAPAIAELAYRFDCPVVPARVERLTGARFRVTFEPPLEKPSTGDRQQDVKLLMTAINDRLSAWIRERPEQWLWVHNRWPNP
jgi:Kdo2-lipid IVA lauroyltransferase/acyltransferase